MELEFRSKEELYQRIYPALSAKKSELERIGYYYIHERDIWEFLSTTIFPRTKGLTLADIVSEIMHIEEIQLIKYIKNKRL